MISKKYHYEKFKLTRLNFYAKIFFRKFHYERVYEQYDVFFVRFYDFLFFIFEMLFIILNAM